MEIEPRIEASQRELARAFASAQLTVSELWLRYFAYGGNAGQVEIEAYLEAMMPLTALQHNILAQAINERINELGPPQLAPFRDD